MEWIKELLGEAYTDALGKAITDRIGKDFVSRADFNTVNETKKALEKTVKERDGQLEELKKTAGASEELQKQIAKLQEDNKLAAATYEKELAGMKLDHALEGFLRDQKAKNPKAVRGLLDLEKVKLDGDKLLGVEEQIKALRTSDAYLFTGGDPVPGAPNPAPDPNPKPEPKTPIDKVANKVSKLFG